MNAWQSQFCFLSIGDAALMEDFQCFLIGAGAICCELLASRRLYVRFCRALPYAPSNSGTYELPLPFPIYRLAEVRIAR